MSSVLVPKERMNVCPEMIPPRMVNYHGNVVRDHGSFQQNSATKVTTKKYSSHFETAKLLENYENKCFFHTTCMHIDIFDMFISSTTYYCLLATFRVITVFQRVMVSVSVEVFKFVSRMCVG